MRTAHRRLAAVHRHLCATERSEPGNIPKAFTAESIEANSSPERKMLTAALKERKVRIVRWGAPAAQAGKLKPLATETDGTTGNQDNAIAPCKGSSDACGETIDRCGGIPPQQTRAQLHHPQRHAVGAPIQAARRRSNRWTRSWRQGCPDWEMGRTSTV